MYYNWLRPFTIYLGNRVQHPMKKINIGSIGCNPFKILNDHLQLNHVAISNLTNTWSLANVIIDCGIKLPVENKSLINIIFNLKKETIIQEINNTFEKASLNELKNIFFFTKDPIVSPVINNSYYSCTFDSQMTFVI